jgi:hypothetical protein
MGYHLELFINVVYDVLKCRLCFDISEPKRGVPGQRDAGGAGAGYRCRQKMSSLLWYFRACTGGMPGQRDAGTIVAGYKSRLCCASN